MSLGEARRHLERIAAGRRDFVSLGPYGVVAAVDEEWVAFKALRGAAILASLRPELESMVAGGSPAARVYAALLLQPIDEDAGTAALESMVDSLETCRVAPGGCMAPPFSRLGSVAIYLLGERRRSLATLHDHLDELERYEDLPDDTDDPAVLPLVATLARYSPDQRSRARARIEETIRGVRAGAKVIAALVLRDFDPEAGRQALIRLATDRTGLWLGRRESERYTSVGAFARRFLDAADRAALPPEPPLSDAALSHRRPRVRPTRWERFKSWFVSLG